jgi:hypothetical protein
LRFWSVACGQPAARAPRVGLLTQQVCQ